jgi:hypothetical protein
MKLELANQYVEFKLPEDIRKMLLKNNLSLSAARMGMFSDTVGLTNEDIDNFMSLKPERMEDESFEDYKNRRVFAKHLFKRRALIYDYSVYENN